MKSRRTFLSLTAALLAAGITAIAVASDTSAILVSHGGGGGHSSGGSSHMGSSHMGSSHSFGGGSSMSSRSFSPSFSSGHSSHMSSPSFSPSHSSSSPRVMSHSSSSGNTNVGGSVFRSLPSNSGSNSSSSQFNGNTIRMGDSGRSHVPSNTFNYSNGNSNTNSHQFQLSADKGSRGSSGSSGGSSKSDGGVRINSGGGGGGNNSSKGDSGGRSNNAPRIDNTPRIDNSARNNNSSKIDLTPRDTGRSNNAPKIDSSTRSNNTNKIDLTPRDTGRNNNPVGDIGRGNNRLDNNTKIDNSIRNNNSAGDSLRNNNRLDNNTKIDSSIRNNNNSIGDSLKGNSRLDNNTKIDSNRLDNNVGKGTLRNNEVPKVGDTGRGRNDNNVDLKNSNRVDNQTNRLNNSIGDRAKDNNRLDNNVGDKARDNNRLDSNVGDKNRLDTKIGDRVKDNNRLDNNVGDKARDNKLDPKVGDRVRDNNRLDNNVGDKNRLDTKIGDRVKDNNRLDNNLSDKNRSNLNRDLDKARENTNRVRTEGVKPVVIRPDKGNADISNRISNREKISVKNINNQTVNLTPINRPGIGAGFGRNNIADRQLALNGLMHTSAMNRNVRLNGHFHDWQAFNGNNYWRHSNWHRGYWNYNRWNGFYGPNWWGFGVGLGGGFGLGYGGWGGGWGGGGWGGGWGGWGGGYGYPLAMSFGVSPWGMNYCAYNFGLYNYSNPYCYGPTPFYGGYNYDYTQPLYSSQQMYGDSYAAPNTIAQNVDPNQQSQQSDADQRDFDAARSSFSSGNYDQALKSIEAQIQKTPKDTIVHEFRGLVLFAMGRYDDAAIPVYSVLAVGPGWDWATMSTLYPGVDVYAAQLKALEDYHRANPEKASASFLLAYHYLTCGHTEAAAAQLDNVLRLNPQDIVATRLLQALGDGTTAPADQNNAQSTDDQTTAALPLAVPDLPAPPASELVKAEDLYGNWSATNSKGKTFLLTLKQDGTFEWQAKDEKQAIDQKGVFGVEGETLAMEPDGGGVLMGKVTKPADGSFKFAIVGGLPDDQALEFKAAK